MIALGQNAGFIITAYAAAAVIVGGLITWVLLDYRVQREALAGMEKRGVKRLSRGAGRT